MRRTPRTLQPVDYAETTGRRRATGGQTSSGTNTNPQVAASLTIVNGNWQSFLPGCMSVDLNSHGGSARQRILRSSSAAADMLARNALRHTIASANARHQKQPAASSKKRGGTATKNLKAKKSKNKSQDKYKNNVFKAPPPDDTSVIGIKMEQSPASVMNLDSGNDVVMNSESGNDGTGNDGTISDSDNTPPKVDGSNKSPEDVSPPPTAVVDVNTEVGNPGNLKERLANEWSKDVELP